MYGSTMVSIVYAVFTLSGGIAAMAAIGKRSWATFATRTPDVFGFLATLPTVFIFVSAV
jgi:hypothetical protein